MRYIVNLNTGARYYYKEVTPYLALQKMIAYINTKEECDDTIQKTESGLHLYIEHKGNVFATRNN